LVVVAVVVVVVVGIHVLCVLGIAGVVDPRGIELGCDAAPARDRALVPAAPPLSEGSAARRITSPRRE
jgi:hypothetical protein